MSKEKNKETNNEVLNEEIEEQADELAEEELAETSDEEECDGAEVSEDEEKIKALEDKYLRLLAEYDNYQKRTTREKEARYADALIDTVSAFLPVLDDLERALGIETKCEETEKFKSGVEMVQKKMREVLCKLDVEEIKAVGEEFDPNIHNAIQHVEDENITENTVTEEYMKGYIYKGTRVVRHSMVKVAN